MKMTPGQWESWTFPDDVEAAVRQLRSLLLEWPGAKVLAQSVDRRYMRVTFEQAQLSGVYVDDCQFYVVPTGADSGGAAVVQCRRGMAADFGLEGLAGEPAAGFFNRRYTRERLRELRAALGWQLRTAGSGDVSESFQRLQSIFREAPLGNVAPIQISEEEIARMSEGASVFSL